MTDRLPLLYHRTSVLAAALVAILACASLSGQTTPLSGSYGFVAGVAQIDSAGANGGAVVGLANFDGAGNVTGNAIVQPRSLNPDNVKSLPTTFRGPYSLNPDGTGTMTLNFDVGFSVTLAIVISDGGKGFQMLETDCNPCGVDIPLRGQPQSSQSLTGMLPISLFFPNASGGVPLTLTGVNNADGGVTVYTANAANGSGSAQCPDGTTGTWTADIPTVTLAVNRGDQSGNFLAAAIGRICGQGDFETISGLVTGSINPAGTLVLTLHGTGSVATGTGRAAAGGASLNGSYGVQLNFSPFPAGTLGVLQFDGAGNVTLAATVVGGPTPATGTFTGTYALNPDGTGSISLINPAGQPAGGFAFVVTDNGSQLLLLRTDVNPRFDVSYGTARLQ